MSDLIKQCDECNLDECINCEHSWADIQEIKKLLAKKDKQLAIRDKMIEIASENFIYYENEKEHKKELKRQFAFWEKLAKESKNGTTKRIK